MSCGFPFPITELNGFVSCVTFPELDEMARGEVGTSLSAGEVK